MKKAMILYYPIIMGFVIGLAFFYVNSLMSESQGQTNYVGEIALNYLKTEKSIKPILSYIEDSAEQASYQSFYDLALNGGFYTESECGSYQQTNLWISETKDCYPEVNKTITSFLNEHLNNYLAINEDTSQFINNYDFLLKQEENKLRIMGIATLPIIIPITIKEEINKKSVEKQIGNYSIKPSFEHIVDYNLNDYNTIKETIMEIASTCEKEADINKCVEQKIVAINALHEAKPQEYPLKWNIGNSNAVEKLFYGFVEKYESCLNSKDTNCRCDFKLDYDNTDLKGEYVITISHDQGNTNFELTKPSEYDLAYTIKNHLPAALDRNIFAFIQQFKSFEYSVSYSSSSNYQSTKLIYQDKINEFDLTTGTMLYKKNKEKVVFIGRDSTEYQALEECSIPNIFRFSVINENNKFFVYDKITNKAEFKSLETKFGIYVKDLPPPPIEGLEATSEQKAEGSVLLSWKESNAFDVAGYNIYFSQNNFLRQEIKENSKIENPITHTDIEYKQTSSRLMEENIYEKIHPTVLYDYSKKIWGHNVFKDGPKIEKLKPQQLYYATETKEYFYILDGLEDNKKYYFAVTAIDKAGNEINNKDSEQRLELDKNYVSATPEDNLAPNKITNLVKQDFSRYYYRFTFNLPETNEDGTSLKEDRLYLYAYLVESHSCAFDDIKFKISNAETRSNNYFPQEGSPQIILMNLKKDSEYCLTFVMKDETENPDLGSSNLKDIIVNYGLHTLS